MKSAEKNVSLVQKMRCALTVDESVRIVPVQKTGATTVIDAETAQDTSVNAETAVGSVRMSANVRKTVKTARDFSAAAAACATTV